MAHARGTRAGGTFVDPNPGARRARRSAAGSASPRASASPWRAADARALAAHVVLALVLLGPALSGCALRGGAKTTGVPIEQRPTPDQPKATQPAPRDTVPVERIRVEPVVQDGERALLLQRVVADTTEAGAAIRRCAGRRLLPEQESTIESALNFLRETREALRLGEISRAEQSSRKAKALATSLRCP
jgi:hypothetical protein